MDPKISQPTNKMALPPLAAWWDTVYRDCPKWSDDPFGFFSFSYHARYNFPIGDLSEGESSRDSEQHSSNLKGHFKALASNYPDMDSISLRKKMVALCRALKGIDYLYDSVDVSQHTSAVVIARARQALLLPALLNEIISEIRENVKLEGGSTLKTMWNLQGSAGHESQQAHTEAFLSLKEHPVQMFVDHLRDCSTFFTAGNDDCEDAHPAVKPGLEYVIESCFRQTDTEKKR